MSNVVYVLQCGDGSLYTGWTNDLQKRLTAHQSGNGCKYTRSHLPVRLAYSEPCETKQDALRREREIKALSRAQKLRLCGLTKQEANK